MDISKVLDDAKKVMRIESDYELAKRLEINKANLTHYRKGNRIPDAYACARLADVLGIDPLALLAQIEAETEKNEARRNYWRALSERVGRGVTLGFFVALFGITVSPEKSYAAGIDKMQYSMVSNFQNL